MGEFFDQLMNNLTGIILLLVIVGIAALAIYRVGARFLIRRLAGLVFVLFGVSFITFILGYLAPINFVLLKTGGKGGKAFLKHLMHLYGLDLPWYQQYANYLNGLLHFNLGASWTFPGLSVTDIFNLYLPASAQLGLTATILAIVIGIPVGVYTAVHANSRFDTLMQSAGMVLFALPSFILIVLFQLLMVVLYSNGLPSLAGTGWGTPDTMVGPILLFAVGSFAGFTRITRASMMEVLRQDYVRAARAKGLSEGIVIWRHAFRNASLNVLSSVGPALGTAVTGVFIFENFFNIPGIGSITLSATLNGDIPVLQGTTIFFALLIALANFVTDIVYGIADPRVKTL